MAKNLRPLLHPFLRGCLPPSPGTTATTQSFARRVPAATAASWLGLLALACSCHRPPKPVAVSAASDVAPVGVPVPAPAQAANDALPFVAADTLLAEAQPLWQKRADLPSLRACIDLFERALVQRPGDGALASQLARAYFLLGYSHLRPVHDVVGMKQAFERGMLAAEQALGETSPPFRAVMDQGGGIEDALGAVDAGGLDALTWYVGNLGGFAASKGSTVALFYAERLRHGLERLLLLDETHFYGTPHRFMAIYLAKMPAFAGGSLKASRSHFEQALALAPNYFDNGLCFAQIYAQAKHDPALYRHLLEAIDQGDASALPEVAPELTLQQLQARQALGQQGLQRGAQQ